MGEITVEVPDNDEALGALSEDIDSIRDQQIEIRAAIAEVCGKVDAVAAASLAATEGPALDLGPVLSSIDNLRAEIDDKLAAMDARITSELEAAVPPVIPQTESEVELPPPATPPNEGNSPPPGRNPFAILWEWLTE